MQNQFSSTVLGALLSASSGEKPVQKAKPKHTVTMDSVTVALDAASAYAEADIRLRAVSAVQEWIETESLEEGETYADRLLALMVGIADENKDGELTDDENELVNLALDAAYDYLVNAGVSEDDADKLLSDFSPEVADRVRELLAATLPADADDSAVDSFVFGPEDQEPALDAVYKMKMAIRGGRKVRIKKRISGRVRLSARQKVAIAKMHRRSHSAAAQVRRMRSMRVARRMGL